MWKESCSNIFFDKIAMKMENNMLSSISVHHASTIRKWSCGLMPVMMMDGSNETNLMNEIRHCNNFFILFIKRIKKNFVFSIYFYKCFYLFSWIKESEKKCKKNAYNSHFSALFCEYFFLFFLKWCEDPFRYVYCIDHYFPGNSRECNTKSMAQIRA